MNARAHKGLTMVELMVAMSIGAFLIAGATQVYINCKKAYDIYQTSARLQETARYAMSLIEPDVRLANYYGFLKGGGLVAGSTPQTGSVQNALAGTSATMCGNNFSVDLATDIEGSNDNYPFACGAFNGRPVLSADTLTIRRASTVASALAAGTTGPLRVCSTRVSGQLVNNAAACIVAPIGIVADLLVHAYYVDRDSATQANMPSLHQWTLNQAVAPALVAFNDIEIVSGIEDLQVQFGIDPTGNTGVATQYVDPFGPAAMPPGAQIVAVRIWLLVMSDSIDVGYTDPTTYQYGNRSTANGTTANLSAAGAAGLAYAPADNRRRLLVSRTIMLRNSLGT